VFNLNQITDFTVICVLVLHHDQLHMHYTHLPAIPVSVLHY